MIRFRLIPVLLLVSCLALLVRVGEVLVGLNTLSGQAVAEEKKEPASAQTETHGEEAKKQDGHAPAASHTDQKKADAPSDDKGPEKESPKEWPDPGDADIDEYSEERRALLVDLSTRRKELDTREQTLATREAVLKAAEAEIEQKYKELAELRDQLQTLLNQQSAEEEARTKSLVRIYEGMKPADAARIFNTLDLNILLDVISRMSERKTAPIMAAMEADRARTITRLMAQQKKLPELPKLGEGASASN